jgi:hypothetical protein
MLRSITAFLAVLRLACGSVSHAQESRPAALAVTLPTFQNVNCPIMGKPTSTTLFVDTPMGRIYTCCPPCNAKIRRDPATAHKAAYPKITKLENKTCPITGKAIPAGAPTVVLQGYEFSVCCKDCVQPAQDNSQIVLTKLVYTQVRDLGNTVCPLTGRPAEKNAFVLIGDDLVHLSSTRCFQVVLSAPEETLKKAKHLVPVPEPKSGESKPADPKAAGNSARGDR